LALLPIFIRKH
jgi:hypothetical protein